MVNKSIKKNYVFNVLYQILKLIAPLVTTPYISRVLGAGGVGIVSFAESIAAYFVLFATMGITTYGQREISYLQDATDKRSEIFWNTKFLEFFTSIVIFLIYVCYSLLQADSAIYLILAFNILAVFADVSWLYQGMEEFGRIVFKDSFFKLVNIVYLFLAVKTREDVYAYAFGIAFFSFLSNCSLWVSLNKFVKPVPIRSLRPFKNIKIVLSLFVPTIAINIYTVLDKTMIGIITQNPFENGYYEQAIKLSRMVIAFVTSMGAVMIPRIGYLYNKSNNSEIQRLMYRGYRFVWMLGIPLCFGLIMTADNFVPWFFGPGYAKAATLIKILAFLILAIGINNVTGMQYLIPTKRQITFTFTVLIGAGVNFVLNSILIRYYASIGAAIASVAAEAAIAVVQLVIVRKELSPLRVLKEGIHYYLAGGVMSAVLFVVGRNLEPALLNTILLVIIGAVVYGAVVSLERDDFVVSNVKIVLNKFKRDNV